MLACCCGVWPCIIQAQIQLLLNESARPFTNAPTTSTILHLYKPLLLLYNTNAPDIFNHHQPLSHLSLHRNTQLVGHKFRQSPIRLRANAPCTTPLPITLHSCPRLYCPATRHCNSTRSTPHLLLPAIITSIHACIQVDHDVDDGHDDLSCDQHNHDPLQVFT